VVKELLKSRQKLIKELFSLTKIKRKEVIDSSSERRLSGFITKNGRCLKKSNQLVVSCENQRVCEMQIFRPAKPASRPAGPAGPSGPASTFIRPAADPASGRPGRRILFRSGQPAKYHWPQQIINLRRPTFFAAKGIRIFFRGEDFSNN